MEHHDYEAIDSQKHSHRRFEEKLVEFQRELHDNPLTAHFEILEYLKEWLVRHILYEDAKLSELVT